MPYYRPRTSSRLGLAACTLIAPAVVIVIAAYTGFRAARRVISAVWPVLIERKLGVGISRVNQPQEQVSDSASDPVFTAYPFGQLRRDLRVAFSTGREQFEDEIKKIHLAGHKELIDERPTLTFWPLWVGYLGGIYLAYLIAVIGFAVVAILQLAVFAIVMGTMFVVFTVGVVVWEKAITSLRQIRLSCPYGPMALL